MTPADDSGAWPRPTYAEWLAAARADLDGDALRSPADDGVALQPLFTRADLPPSGQDAEAAQPPPAATPPRLAWLCSGPASRADLPAIDGFDLVRVADPDLELCLAGGDAAPVRRLDPDRVVLTVSATPTGARALATLERAGLRHAVVLDALDRVDGEPPARELALLLAATVDVVRNGGDAAAAAPAALAARLLTPVCIDTDVVTQIAKVRAARWLWCRALTACGAPAPRARVWGKASAMVWSAIDPETNLVRSALQMFVATAAGCYAFEPLLHDPVRAGDDARRLAANQLRLLQHEAGTAGGADVAAGAFAIEALTAQIARSAWRMLQAIEAQGGAGATRGGRDALPVAPPVGGARTLVGTNRFADPAARVTEALPAGGARPAAPFEGLRRRTATQRLDALLLPFGEPAAARAHAEWAIDLLRTAGIEPVLAARCASLAAARTELARQPSARIVVCCGVDDAGGAFTRGVLVALAARAPRPLLYATGTPPAGSEGWGAIGFLHQGLDAVGTLGGILDRLGVGSA